MKAVLGGVLALELWLLSGAALASVAVTPGKPGQARLAVGFDGKGQLRAAVCRTGPCGVEGGQSLGLPEELSARREHAKLVIVPLGKARYTIHVRVPREQPGRAWEALVVATAAGAVSVLFSGETGFVDGAEGERSGPVVSVSGPTRDGARRVVVGEALESMSLCGRPAVMSPRMLVPGLLQLRPAKVQRLSAEERDAAQVVSAVAQEGEAPKAAPLLRAISASSAVGNPAALTDGDPETTWAENRGGSGKGEFVLMLAPPEVPIGAFELVVRPPTREVPSGAAPKRFWLALTSELFRVDMPEDAWKFPGRRYRVELPRPVNTDCVGLVVDDAFDAGPKAQVSFSELTAESDFDLKNLDGLVGALAGGGERSEAAGALLRGLGTPAFEAILRRYSDLDAAGRRLALDVVDHAGCEYAAPVYVKALLSDVEAHRIHAEHRITRCGATAVPHLTRAMDREPSRAGRAALALALIAPGEAVDVLLARLGKQLAGSASGSSTENSKSQTRQARRARQLRKQYRAALTTAAGSPAAAPSMRRALASGALSDAVRIELLRALGTRLLDYGAVAEQSLSALLSPKADFRSRYLLVEPLAAMAPRSARLRAELARLISQDPSHHVRAAAARSVTEPSALKGALLGALNDENVRVREAAASALGSKTAGFAAGALVLRLTEDKWPLVRSTAARSLAELPKSRAVDRALAQALEDESAHVRRPVVLALGSRKALAHAKAVEERLDDRDERPDVRAAAAMALGRMCSKRSVSLLTSYAVRLANPHADPEMRGVAAAALLALARLKPTDLRSRLEPFFAPEVPPPARRAAESAITAPRGC